MFNPNTNTNTNTAHTHTHTDRMAHMLTDKSARHMDRHEERMKAIRESGILNTVEIFTTFLGKYLELVNEIRQDEHMS